MKSPLMIAVFLHRSSSLAPSSFSALPLRNHSSRFLPNTSKSSSSLRVISLVIDHQNHPVRHRATLSPTSLPYTPLESIAIMCNTTRVVRMCIYFPAGIFLFLLHLCRVFAVLLPHLPHSYPSSLPSHTFVFGLSVPRLK